MGAERENGAISPMHFSHIVLYIEILVDLITFLHRIRPLPKGMEFLRSVKKFFQIDI
jgi:hypothetical protein